MSDRRPRILSIDDDPDLRITLACVLTDLGFDVYSAADGPSGLDQFLTHGADVVLLDLALPGMDGLSVCRELKALAGDTHLPVIFVTGRSDARTKVQLLEEGDDFCVKPFPPEELVARIHVQMRIAGRAHRLATESGRLRIMSLTDALTGLGNRRALDTTLGREWARMERSGRPLAVLMADIDRFKAFNDTHGHQAGDSILKAVARGLEQPIRNCDQVFRFGGEEFVVVLPEATREGALLAAERIRNQVAAQHVGPLSVTVSVGVAVAPNPATPNPGALIEAADHALFVAKAAGRNRVMAVVS